MNANPHKQATPPPPWHKQFWPWFLIALPLSVVIASIFTIYLAVMNPDPLVKKEQHQKLGPIMTEKQNHDND